MRVKKNLLLLLLFIIAVLAVGCGQKEQPQQTSEANKKQVAAQPVGGQVPEPKKDLDIVRTFSRKDCTLADFLVAQKKGFLEKEGIKLVFTGELSPEQKVPSILSGDNDVDAQHANTLAIVNAGGGNLKAVATTSVDPQPLNNPHLVHMAWYVNQNSQIKSFADLKNIKHKIKISVLARDICADYVTDVMLRKYGIPRDKVEYVVLYDLEAAQAVKKGLIDIATSHPVFYGPNEKAGNRRIATSLDAGPYAGTALLIFNNDFIKKNPDVVKRFVRGIKNAENWINNNMDETNRLVEKEIGVTIDANHYYAPEAKISDEGIQQWLNWTVESGGIKKDQIKIEDVITHDFDSFVAK